MILAIDPGNEQSAYVVIDKQLKPVIWGKEYNKELLKLIYLDTFEICDDCYIEMIASYGMPVGKEVFETCVWIGRFKEALLKKRLSSGFIYRKDVKLHLCGSPRARDGNIIQALKDRFGDKGTKAQPGFFHGFKADCWQSYAVGVTGIETRYK